MLKDIFKKITSLLLVAVIVIGLMPGMVLSAAAATTKDIVEGLDASGDFADILGGIKIEATSTAYKPAQGCSSAKDAAAKSASATLTSTLNVEAKLSFDYTIDIQKMDGYVKISDEAQTANGHFEQTVAGGAIVNVEVFSGKPAADYTGTYTSKIEITNISLAVDKDVTTTFLPAENGSYTVDGTAVTAEYQHTKNATEATALIATPAEGYIFLGWYSQKAEKFVSLDTEWNTHLTEEQTIEARFAPATAPVFQVGTDFRSPDLNEAVEFATTKGPKTVVLIQNGTLPAGDYTILSGVTLLIPFDADNTLYTSTPGNTGSSWTAPYVFRKLTMASGAALTVENGGAISVSAKFAARGGNQNPNGATTGPYGQIQMDTDSSIVLENGSALYAWGYVTGDGKILAKAGSKAYEYFQISDFRGGSATLALYNGRNEYKVFPFSQYYIQNIEASITFESGANEYGYTGLYASSTVTATTISFIGATGSLFNLTSGTLTKRYDPTTDRLMVTVNGDMNVDQITVTAMGKTVNSKDFVLPVNGNISFEVAGGTTTIGRDASLLPGVKIVIDPGATFAVAEGIKLYVYDSEEWLKGIYAATSQMRAAVYSPTAGRKTRTVSDLTDVDIQVEGTLQVNGTLYTTEAGANINTTTGNGTVVFASAPASAKLYEINNNKVSGSSFSAKIDPTAMIDIPVTPAKLKNASADANEYSVTADAKAGDTFYYHDGMWDNQNAPKETAPHILVETWEKDETDHWKTCTVCGTKVQAAAHTWDEGVVTEGKEPTCTTEGEMTYTCTVCGQTKTETAPATGHTYAAGENAWTWAKDEETGIYTAEVTLTCTACDEGTEGHSITESATVSEPVVVPATCAKEGSKTYTATVTVGKATYTDENVETIPVDETAHVWNDGEITTAATCVATGVKTFTCTVCNGTKTETAPIDPTNHANVVTDARLEATCYATGLTEGSHCEACNTVITAQEVVEKTAHAYGEPVFQWTKTEAGVWTAIATFTCTAEGCTDAAEGHTLVKDAKVSEKERVNATHTEDGYVIYQAVVDSYTAAETRTETLKAEGHKLTAVAAKDPTCAEVGNRAYWTCSGCDVYFKNAEGTEAYESKDDVVVKATGHEYDYASPTWSWTESGEGYAAAATFTCTKCAEGIEGHTVTEDAAVSGPVVADATCTTKGSKTYTATVTVDGAAKTDTKTVEIPVDGNAHDWGDWQITEDGKHTRTCNNDPTHTETAEHRFGDWVIDTDATCGVAGSKHHICSDCGYSESESIAATGNHSWSAEWSTNNENHWHVCTACGAKKDEKAHQEDAGKVTTEATCTTKGEKTFVCLDCGKVLRTEEVELAAHQYEDMVTAPTCTKDGYTTHTCKDCGQSYTDNEIKATGHAYGAPGWSWSEGHESATATFTCIKCEEGTEDHTVIVPATVSSSQTKTPTCIEKGEMTYIATVTIGGNEYTATETVEVSALGHTMTETEAKAATCTEAGNNAYWTCGTCGKVFSDAAGTDETTVEEQTIAALKHSFTEFKSWGEWVAVENGYTRQVVVKCSRCDETENQAATVTGPVVVDSTCKRQGTKTYTSTWGDETDTKVDVIKELAEHTWNNGELITAPTCTQEGVKNYTCYECGTVRSESVAVDADAHDWGKWTAAEDGKHTRTCNNDATHTETAEHRFGNWVIDTDATCGVAGSRHHICGDCGYRENESIAATGNHSWSEQWSTDGTNHWHECSVCGAENDKAAHNENEGTITKQPTCTTAGVKTFACTVCGVELRTEVINQLGHNSDGSVAHKDATCTETGVVGGTYCTRCGEGKEAAEAAIEAAGHKWDEGTVTKKPTEAETGVRTYTCTVCNATKTEEIPVLEHVHSYGEWTITKAATCTEDGEQKKTCSCGDAVTEAITALGHDMHEVEGSYKAPTCTEPGKEADKKCSRCDHTEIGAGIAANGHTGVKDAAVEPTCTEDGKTEGIHCSTCGEIIIAQEVIPAKGHSWVADGEPRPNGECGLVQDYTCSVCDATKTEAVDGSSHTPVDVEEVPATCTESGLTAGVMCEVCGAWIVEPTVIPALGHDMHEVEGSAKAPTCTEPGKDADMECSRCGHIETGAAIPANGHTVETDAAVEPTCTESGLTAGSHCSVCGETIKAQEEITALGHNEDSGTTVGYITTYSCTRCGTVLRTVDNTPSNPNPPVVNPPVNPNPPADDDDPNGEEENPPIVDIEDGETALGDKPFPFIDVTKNDWFYGDVEKAFNMDLMHGTGDKIFDPQDTTTRAMVAEVLYRLSGKPSIDGYDVEIPDLKETDWFYESAVWAYATGVYTGYEDGAFRGEKEITREELAAVLFRFAANMGYDVTEVGDLTVFKDEETVSSWALGGTKWAVGNGILKGRAADQLVPWDLTIRAELATVLVRFVNEYIPEMTEAN